MNKGSILLSSTYKDAAYYICPSVYKHGALYFGKGLKSYLTEKHIELDYFIDDNTSYVINNNGHKVLAIPISDFFNNRDEIAVYQFYDSHGLNTQIMSIAANYSCCFLNKKFTFSSKGNYCFEIIIKSYMYVVPYLHVPTVRILGHNFYNSKSITHSGNFKPVKKKHKSHYSLYHNTCSNLDVSKNIHYYYYKWKI